MTREEFIDIVYDQVRDESADKIINAMDKLLKQQAVQGEWIKDGQFWRCSECGTRIFSESYMDRQIYHAFCGRCGANMTKGGDEE